MPSCISKYRFARVRISFLASNIVDGAWKPLQVDPRGQQDKIGRSHSDMLSCMSKYRISIHASKIISADWKLLKADLVGQISKTCMKVYIE